MIEDDRDFWFTIGLLISFLLIGFVLAALT